MKKKAFFSILLFHEELSSLFKANPISIFLFPQKSFSNRCFHFLVSSGSLPLSVLWCLSATSCGPTSLHLHSSSFCACAAGFSLAISVSTSLSLSSLTSLDLSLCYPPASPHTQSPASSISHEMGHRDFPVFKNTLFP